MCLWWIVNGWCVLDKLLMLTLTPVGDGVGIDVHFYGVWFHGLNAQCGCCVYMPCSVNMLGIHTLLSACAQRTCLVQCVCSAGWVQHACCTWKCCDRRCHVFRREWGEYWAECEHTACKSLSFNWPPRGAKLHAQEFASYMWSRVDIFMFTDTCTKWNFHWYDACLRSIALCRLQSSGVCAVSPVSSHFVGTCRILSGLERVSCQWVRTCQLSVG